MIRNQNSKHELENTRIHSDSYYEKMGKEEKARTRYDKMENSKSNTNLNTQGRQAEQQDTGETEKTWVKKGGKKSKKVRKEHSQKETVQSCYKNFTTQTNVNLKFFLSSTLALLYCILRMMCN